MKDAILAKTPRLNAKLGECPVLELLRQNKRDDVVSELRWRDQRPARNIIKLMHIKLKPLLERSGQLGHELRSSTGWIGFRHFALAQFLHRLERTSASPSPLPTPSPTSLLHPSPHRATHHGHRNVSDHLLELAGAHRHPAHVSRRARVDGSVNRHVALRQRRPQETLAVPTMQPRSQRSQKRIKEAAACPQRPVVPLTAAEARRCCGRATLAAPHSPCAPEGLFSSSWDCGNLLRLRFALTDASVHYPRKCVMLACPFHSNFKSFK